MVNTMHTSRRDFLKSSLATIAVSTIPQRAGQTGTTLLRGGRVLSLDPSVGDFEKADVLIDGSKIAMGNRTFVRRRENNRCGQHDVMPGFTIPIAMRQAQLRNILPTGCSATTRDITAPRAYISSDDVHRRLLEIRALAQSTQA
jgi:hypothetical protein